jgi:hypothetical protein
MPLLFTWFTLSPAATANDRIADLLSGHQWLVRSLTLGNGVTLAATFHPDGSFHGMITAPPSMTTNTQKVSGTWVVTPPLIFLQWDWIEGTGAFASPRRNEIPIEVSNFSARKLTGVDKWWRLWTFERIDNY